MSLTRPLGIAVLIEPAVEMRIAQAMEKSGRYFREFPEIRVEQDFRTDAVVVNAWGYTMPLAFRYEILDNTWKTVVVRRLDEFIDRHMPGVVLPPGWHEAYQRELAAAKAERT